MSAEKTETMRLLGIMLREFEQTVIPDLNSPHAKTVANLIDFGMRHLLAREESLPGLLDQWKQLDYDLIAQAGLGLPEGMPDHGHGLRELIESIVAERLSASRGAEPDDLCRAAIGAEKDFLAKRARTIETVTVPQRTPERRDLLAMTPDRLKDYFASRLPQYQSHRIARVTPILSGFSKETILVDLETDGAAMPVVIRRNIPHGAVDTTVVDEYPVLVALYRHGLPVPEPVLLETDSSEFGEAFTVTRRAPGAAATNSMAGLVAGPELVTAAYELAAFLARLHRINLEELGLPHSFYDPALTTHDYLMREIDICERYYRNHRTQPSPTIAAALAWLRANVPRVDGPPRLVHGDAGLANLMMDGDKMSVMLDWELAHPGDPVEDVTYTRKWIDQVMPWEDFLEHYYKHGGPKYHPEREKFYAMLSDLRVAVFSVRTQDMLNKSDHPELTQMYAAQHYYGYFINNIANSLLT